MKVSILSARNLKAHVFTYPIRAFRQQLKDVGIDANLFFEPHTPALFDCDVLCIARAGFKEYFTPSSPDQGSLERRIEWLQSASSKTQAVVLFDTGDSTGGVDGILIEHVDLYAKCQMLKDRQRYTQVLYGTTIFTDYYHKRFGIVDEQEKLWGQINPEDLHKLTVSWNIGLGDWKVRRSLRKVGRGLAIYWPWANYGRVDHALPYPPERPIQISFRVTNASRPATVAYQRDELRNVLAGLAEKYEHYVIRRENTLPYHAYKRELKEAQICPSPFGWGEVCFRDFEAFIFGATLLKPDMSHMETWPDFYQEDKTYVSHKWDLSDFEERVVELLESTDKRLRIAESAQSFFFECISRAGGERFAHRFGRLMQMALEKRKGASGRMHLQHEEAARMAAETGTNDPRPEQN